MSFFEKNFLGVDIGTSSIKIVELALSKKKVELKNYGEIFASSINQKYFRNFEKSSLILSTDEIAEAIAAVVEEAGIKTKKVSFSLPDFATFFTNFKLPDMSIKEIPQAVEFEAKRYIPLPIKNLVLDWKIVNEKNQKKGEEKEIVLVAVPTNIVNQYKEIALKGGLDLISLEAETFGLARLFKEKSEEPIVVLDIGSQSTTINVVEKGVLKLSYSFDVAGNNLTSGLMDNFDIDYSKAEELKIRNGIETEKSGEKQNGKSIRDVLIYHIDLIFKEVKKVYGNFEKDYNKKIKEIYLAGGTSMLLGIEKHALEYLKKPIKKIDPFSNIVYPPLLKDKLKRFGLVYAVAIGTAIKEFKP